MAFAALAKRILMGIVLAICGNFLISIAMNIQKYSHNQQDPELPENAYLKSKTWWLGIILMIFGEIGNFSAYGFAPASLVAPLGTTTVIANAAIAVMYLKETIRYQDVLGISLAIVGGFLLINFSTKEDTVLMAKDIVVYLKQWTFLLYLFLELLAFGALVYVQRTREEEEILTHLLQVAILGSFTVISAKAVSSMMSITFQGSMQLSHPIFYVMVIVMVVTAIGQVRCLNRAMKAFDATVVVPTNFVLFTISAIISGIVFYREFYGLQFIEIFMFLFGCMLSFLGVYLITGDRKEEKSESPLVERNELFAAYLPVLSFYAASFVQPNDGNLSVTAGFDQATTEQSASWYLD
eukprot:gene7921-13811_t